MLAAYSKRTSLQAASFLLLSRYRPGQNGIALCGKHSKQQAQSSRKGASKNKTSSAPAPRRAPKHANKHIPKPKAMAPPALLVPTASPFVYVSKPALRDTPDVDPSTLFEECTAGNIPKLFREGEFFYVTPKDFKHELPNHGIPEVFFLGRSNVGKSSLVNAVIRKSLAMTSKSPGRTQQAYYYGLFSRQNQNVTKTASETIPSVSSAIGFVVDLPGYGHANAPTDKVEEWQATTQEILLDRLERGVLQRLYLLLDSRRGSPSDLDGLVIQWLDNHSIPYSMVLTKSDCVSVPMVVKHVNELCLRFASQHALLQPNLDDSNAADDESQDTILQSPLIHVTSSKQGMGISELMFSIETEFVHDDI